MRFERILVPIDFSGYSKNALAYAISAASRFDSELLLLYVVEPAVYPADLGFGQVTLPNIEHELAQRGKIELEKLVESNIAGRAKARTMVRSGKPFHEIITTAVEENADLIVIATHGHTGVEHFIFGSTTEKVVKRAPCPVLIVRMIEH
ncbi:MAG: universal stress protein [Ignavibacteria bacterium]|nr:universal stress protein [Ignavibacteria bacterium]